MAAVEGRGKASWAVREIRVRVQEKGSGYGVQKLSSSYNLCAGPDSGEVLRVAGDQKVGVGGLGAFEENVVVGIRTGSDFLGRFDPNAVLPDGAQRLLNYRFTAMELRAPDYFFVFGIDVAADAELRGGPVKVRRKILAGRPCGCNRAETRTFVSRTTRIIAPTAGIAGGLFVRLLSPHQSARRRVDRGPALAQTSRRIEAIPGPKAMRPHG